MPTIVHHKPINPARAYKIHAWNDASTWDLTGVRSGERIDFTLPDVADARQLLFMFHSTDSATSQESWESDDFIRHVRMAAPPDIWSFESAVRILYQDPAPPGPAFKPGDVLTFQVITQRRFKGGRLYAWNPYDPAAPAAFFSESARTDPVSTFNVPLAAWMTAGFHFKLVGQNPDGRDSWEPDSSNRVWVPGDGATPWVKSGQVSVRHDALTQADLPLEVLFPTALGNAPALDLIDPIEDFHQMLSAAVVPFPGSPVFQLARYAAPMYQDAIYKVTVLGGAEGGAPHLRPFPADAATPAVPSRFILGVDGWVPAFPPVAASATVVVEPNRASTFAGGLTVAVGAGVAAAHERAAAAQQPDGTWRATLTVVQTVPNWLRLIPASGDEPTPYDGIDTRRMFIPPTAPATFFTVEGVYGLTTRGSSPFAEPPSRRALMQAAFGTAVAGAGIFDTREMPHGATRLGDDVYFVLHAPHAAWAALILVDEHTAGGAGRRQVPMALTDDARYWWCKVSAADAPAGARYRFLLNDDQEVLDPAAREVMDRGGFETRFGDDPNNTSTSWSLVLDVDAVVAAAHAAPWQTMGWENLLLYEIHAKRFTDIAPAGLAPLDLLADELQSTNRQGRAGYLRSLPITALQVMPVHEFKSTNSWGYNPAFFFAVDGDYGGAWALARLVHAAHASGRGVLLDLVYNHMNDSPLTQIAREVYTNGNAWGDRVNSGHPMVKEFFRQAIVYQWRTFGLDGFRFDATKTIVNNNGWDFLATMRGAVRAAASAEGRRWPYLVAENDPQFWNLTNPAWSIMDGQWDIDELYDLGHAAYDPWQSSDDHAPHVQARMNEPQTGTRPACEAVRFGESHDSVSAQDPGNQRIAARPPFGQGLQMAKAIGSIPLLSNGVPQLFMGQEVGETRFFSFDSNGPVTNPQQHDLPPNLATDQTRVLAWFRALMGLRNDPAKGLRGNDNAQVVGIGKRTVAFTCGFWPHLFVVVTFGTTDQQQNSAWLGLPGGGPYKEIFNSSWPAFQVESEPEHTNGGYDAQMWSGQLLNLPFIGTVVLERR